jgi:hypothetical protein
VCWRVLRFQDVLTTNFDDDMMLMTCWWWCRWRKKLFERSKNDEKSTLNKTLKKNIKMEPGTGGENPRSGRVARSVYDAIVWGRTCEAFFFLCFLKADRTWEWHVECERSDVRGVLWHMRSILTRVTYPTRGTHESRRVREQRVRAGITKSREDFFWYEVSWWHTG